MESDSKKNGCHPESCSSGVIRLDADLCIVYLDKAAEATLELPSAGLIGKKIELVADLANLGNLMHGGISFSDQVILIGGRRIVCDFVPLVENDLMVGGVLSLLGSIPDSCNTTDDNLREILRSTSAFMNFDFDGIIVVDRNGIVVMVNQSFARLLDTTPQAMIGRHVDQAYQNSQPSHLPMVMETGKPDLGIIHYFNGKQVYANRFPLIKDGRVIGCVGKILFMDIREIPLIARQLQAAPESKGHPHTLNRKEILFKYDTNSIVGQSRKIQELKETLLRVAQKNSNVLLRGESGTGKELFAHAIHAASTRHYSPFVKVNCAAIPEHLLESELFGYAEGAFTGAKKGGQIGKFEQAHTGTIFLDEIGDMPLYMQVKILRVLQEKELTNLGSTKQKTVDVRVVAATNRNLEQMVKEGKFREDLYYRLNVVALTIPALRERKEDIYPLTMNFIEQFNVEFGLSVKDLDADAWEIFKSYDWPGNIRELRNVVESAFNVVSGHLITRAHLPEQLTQLCPDTTVDSVGIEDFIRASLGKKDITQIMDQFENLLLRKAVEFCHGNKQQASRLLGISRQGLYKKLGRQAIGGSDMDDSET
ncbi:sigma-54 interaction domain-containing protein [Geotalea toluenoxydans]